MILSPLCECACVVGGWMNEEIRKAGPEEFLFWFSCFPHSSLRWFWFAELACPGVAPRAAGNLATLLFSVAGVGDPDYSAVGLGRVRGAGKPRPQQRLIGGAPLAWSRAARRERIPMPEKLSARGKIEGKRRRDGRQPRPRAASVSCLRRLSWPRREIFLIALMWSTSSTPLRWSLSCCTTRARNFRTTRSCGWPARSR